jgi:hypothetical protein
MGHSINAVVGPSESVAKIVEAAGCPPATGLSFGLVIAPLGHAQIDKLTGCEPGKVAKGFRYLSPAELERPAWLRFWRHAMELEGEDLANSDLGPRPPKFHAPISRVQADSAVERHLRLKLHVAVSRHTHNRTSFSKPDRAHSPRDFQQESATLRSSDSHNSTMISWHR